MFFFVFTTSLLVFLLFLYVRKCHKFWKNRGAPSTSPNLLFGDIGANVLGKEHSTTVFQRIYKEFPDQPYVGFYEFHKPSLLIRDLALIESILVKDFSHFSDRIWKPNSGRDAATESLFFLRGKSWKNLRSKLITTFSSNKLKHMVPLMDRCADILDSLMREKCEEESADVKDLISRFATDVIGCCVFGLQFNTLTEPESEYRKMGEIIFKPTLLAPIWNTLMMIAPKMLAAVSVRKGPTPLERFFGNVLRQSEEFRKTESGRRNDLMQLILDIRDRDRERSMADKNYDGGIVDNKTVLSNLILFYAAGFETTASALSFCLYELALHPEMQKRARDEVRAILEENQGVLTYETLKKMTYCSMVLAETLRKYTPAGFLRRVCIAPYQLPGTSLKLYPGDGVGVPVYAIHHDEKYYPNPSRFDPERFTPENIAARLPFTYMPFGDGPRICLAVRFAKMEMKLCLARILSKYELSPCGRTEIPLRMIPRAIVLNAKNGIHLRVKSLSQN